VVVDTVPLVVLTVPDVPEVAEVSVDIVSVAIVSVAIVSVVEYSVVLSVVPAVAAVSVVASMFVVSSFLQATNTTSVSAVKSTRSFLAILKLLCVVFILGWRLEMRVLWVPSSPPLCFFERSNLNRGHPVSGYGAEVGATRVPEKQKAPPKRGFPTPRFEN
jgi:hypothetical protein